jgi:ABC-type multidrug transport system ATPase subunit
MPGQRYQAGFSCQHLPSEKAAVNGATIEVNGLRKRFGPVQALDGVSFTVEPGRVTGFIGPNGPGKSTAMRVILGLDAPGYSLGMRQRLGIAAALLGDPPALMLDEPFNGMDPEGIV